MVMSISVALWEEVELATDSSCHRGRLLLFLFFSGVERDEKSEVSNGAAQARRRRTSQKRNREEIDRPEQAQEPVIDAAEDAGHGEQAGTGAGNLLKADGERWCIDARTGCGG